MEKANLTVVCDFLKDLDQNNNRDWFNAHKERYQQAKKEFDAFVDFIGNEIEKFDPSFKYSRAKDYTYRIYRDVRFSKNKAPYKNHFGAFWSLGGRKSLYAGYYVHIQPDASFFGGGLYRPEAKVLKTVRQEIYYSYNQLQNILEDNKFKKLYPEMFDDKLSRGPKDFPKDCQAIELLKYKSFAVGSSVGKEEVISEQFPTQLVEGLKILLPLNQFINDAINMGED